MVLNDKWPADGDSVVTRIDKAGPWGNVDNLKWSPRGSAIANGREHSRQQLLQSVFGDVAPDLGDRLRLASLCKRGHQWNGHPVSLQFKDGSSWRCKECERENNASPTAIATRQAWCEANKEKLRKHARERAATRRADPVLAKADRLKQLTPERAEKRRIYKEKIRQSLREQGLTSRGTVPTGRQGHPASLARAIRTAGRLPSVAALVMAEQRRYWAEHPAAKTEHARHWARVSWWLEYQTKPDLRLYHREKAKRRKMQDRGQTPVQIPVSAIRQRFNKFSNCCAYCGKGGDMEIEHVEPISSGGAHDIGNIVPACSRCNTSKRSHDMEQWYRAQPFFDELRLQRIRRATRPPEGQQLALALA
jgi:5-methylcytosine-specific restriction endonuclease McrA